MLWHLKCVCFYNGIYMCCLALSLVCNTSSLEPFYYISFILIMEIQLTFCQKLTWKLQHILGDNLSKSSIPNTLPRAESTSDTLDAAFEWERIRRSAAPSPELLSKECQRQKIHPDSHELRMYFQCGYYLLHQY